MNGKNLVALVLATPLFGACAAHAGADEQLLAVNIHHSRFTPARYEFDAGDTVRFVIYNGDPIDHEFILGDEAVQRRHEDGTEKEHGAIPGEVSIPAGETRTTTYTFTAPARLIIGCHLPGHYDYGMKAEVRIGR